MDYWLLSLCVSVFLRERCNVQMLKASLSESLVIVVLVEIVSVFAQNLRTA